MKQNQKTSPYADLIKQIKKRKKIVTVIGVIAIIALVLFGSPSTATYTVNGVSETVTSKGLPAGLLVFLILLCLLIIFVALAFIVSPLTLAMDQECDPEKHLVLYLNIYKRIPDSIYLQDHMYLGNYTEAIKYADKMIADRRKTVALLGLFGKARCAFFLGEYDMLRVSVEKYDQVLSKMTRQSEKRRSMNEKCRTVLHTLCALAEHDTEKIAVLRDSLAPWSTGKTAEAFVQYLKALIAYELGEEKDAEFRFKLVAEQYPKLMLARLCADYLAKMSGEEKEENEENDADTAEYQETKNAEEQDSTPTIDINECIIPQKSALTKAGGFKRAISIFLFIASILSIWFALICVGIMSAIKLGSTPNENMWAFFLFLPIPIVSIVFGYYLKKKGHKYKKNVIVGFIMAALLCIYGSFTFAFADIYSHSDAPILSAEQTLNIDIPAHVRINTQSWSNGEQGLSREYIYSVSEIYFEDFAVEAFEKEIENDARWINKIPSSMIGITSGFFDVQADDYCIIYNKDTREFNMLPSESGEYNFINLIYNAESNIMTLVEYKIEFTK